MGHHWPTSETPLKWRFAGGPMMANVTLNAAFVACDFQGIRTSTKKPYVFVIFQGRVRTPCPPPSGSAHVTAKTLESTM